MKILLIQSSAYRENGRLDRRKNRWLLGMTLPYVAALTNRLGQALERPAPRDPNAADSAVTASLAPHEYRLPIDMPALLRL